MLNVIKHNAIFITVLLTFLYPSQSIIATNSSVNSNAKEATISGYMKDRTNGEELIGAMVTVHNLDNNKQPLPAPISGAITNEYGFYSLSLKSGDYILRFSYMGFATQDIPLSITESKRINIEFTPISESIDEVVVTANSAAKHISSTNMGMEQLSMKAIKNIPILFGERDIMKTAQLLPGIKPAGEGSAGFYVRGGAIDQNLILLDEAPVYNASHLMGFFSVFNSDALKDAKIIKGSSTSDYGGRLSSVFDIKMKDGNNKRISGSGGIGIIASKLQLEVPIVKDKGAVMVSGRRTYVDLFTKQLGDSTQKNSELYFYDLNIKANYKISDKNRLFLSGYMGRDLLNYNDEMGIDWGNKTGTLRWNHLFSDRIFSNTTLIYSDFNYNIDVTDSDTKMRIQSGIKDYNFKQDLQLFLSSKNRIKTGVNIIHHTFKLGSLNLNYENEEEREINNLALSDRYAYEGAAYVTDEFKPTNRITISAGLRYSWFNVIGGDSSVYKLYDINGDITSQKSYKKGELVVNYGGFEPRILASSMVNDVSSIKIGYARNRQYIHLISNASTGAPTDVWYPTSPMVKPQIADQVSIGYFRHSYNEEWEGSVELYYKDMQNQIAIKNGGSIMMNEDLEGDLAFGRGISYGAEFIIKRNIGDLTGWLSYTLSRTEQRFDLINKGSKFPARQDRTHDISVVGMYRLSSKWDFSASWIYYTGDAVTYPTGKYVIGGKTYAMYSDRNSNRMPDYHRLDIGANYTPNRDKTRRYQSSWNFSVYNAYGRKNAYSISFRESEDNPNKTEAVKLSLFTFVPSVTWNFSF